MNKDFREGLIKRLNRSYEKKDDRGRFKSIFKEGLDIQFWQCSEGEHLIDIIPYLAGKNDPEVKEGEPTYCLDIWVHTNIGVNEDSYICLSRTYNKPCPICEYQKKLKAQGADPDTIAALNPTRRVVYNIVCYDSEKEEEKGVQVWEVAHWFMERHLVVLAKGSRRSGVICFADPEEGKSIAFTRQGKGRNTQFIGHRFVDRDYKIPPEILESAYTLDEIIHIPTYDEVKEAFFGAEIGAEELEEKEEPKEKEEAEERLRPRFRIRKSEEESEEKSKEVASNLLGSAQSVIDRGVKKGVIHRKTGSRKLSRLTKLVNSISS